MSMPAHLRDDFPILSQRVHKHPLVYLDNGATTQMPLAVQAAMTEQIQCFHANIHRGIHSLSETSTERVETVRAEIASFLGAASPQEIIFTAGATHALNLLARAYADGVLRPGDLVITTEMEHHANLVPWQEACRRTGAQLAVIPLTDTGDLDLSVLPDLLSRRPKLVCLTLVSNVLGTVNPVREILAQAHDCGAAVVVDAAQAMRHVSIRLTELPCDYLVFSAHKMCGPTGVGVLYGKQALLEQLPPPAFGGGMVDTVYLDRSSYGALPFRWEAGTVNITGIIGLGAALRYLQSIGLEQIYAEEARVLQYLESQLQQRPEIHILGQPKQRAGALCFSLDGFHFYDTAKLLDQLGIAVRSGHHCAQPLLRHYGLEGTVRVTPAFYNTRKEIDALCAGLDRIAALRQT